MKEGRLKEVEGEEREGQSEETMGLAQALGTMSRQSLEIGKNEIISLVRLKRAGRGLAILHHTLES